MQVYSSASLNKSERAQILKEYALSVTAGETAKAQAIKDTHSKFISREEWATA